jgi:hypothetical protein
MVSKLPVNPAENFWIIWIGIAEGDSVGPVLGQAVFLGDGLQAWGADGDLHQDVRLLGAGVVLPQGRQRLVRTTITCNKKRNESYYRKKWYLTIFKDNNIKPIYLLVITVQLNNAKLIEKYYFRYTPHFLYIFMLMRIK